MDKLYLTTEAREMNKSMPDEFNPTFGRIYLGELLVLSHAHNSV